MDEALELDIKKCALKRAVYGCAMTGQYAPQAVVTHARTFESYLREAVAVPAKKARSSKTKKVAS